MHKQELEQHIMKALADTRICTLATIEGHSPRNRYMALFHDGLHIHLAAHRQSHKVDELEANPHVALLFGYEEDRSSAIVEVQGTAAVTKNNELRNQLWNEGLKRWFKGPDDPDYVILDITPSKIEYTDKERQLHIWEAS